MSDADDATLSVGQLQDIADRFAIGFLTDPRFCDDSDTQELLTAMVRVFMDVVRSVAPVLDNRQSP